MEDQNISIKTDKRRTSVLNSKGRDFENYLKLYYCRYIVSFSSKLVKNLSFIRIIQDKLEKNQNTASLKNGKNMPALVNKGLTCKFNLISS